MTRRSRLLWSGLSALAVAVAGCSDAPTTALDGLDPITSQAPPGDVGVMSSHTPTYDLTTAAAQAEVGDGVWVQQSIFAGSTGTGVFESFVRLNSNASAVKGFNTSGRPLRNDEMTSANFTRDLQLSAVPLQSLNENGDGEKIYREFRADINQTSGGALLSLDAIKVYISRTAGANPDYPTSTDFGTCSTLVWGLTPDEWIGLNYNLAPGSGNGDMRLLIPDALFTAAREACGSGAGTPADWYVYLYSEFGNQGDEWGQDNGFEEWSVRRVVTAPVAVKDVDAFFDRNYTWTIDKNVSPSSWALFVGDDAESEYSVSVDADYVDSNFRISGTAALLNGGSAIRVSGRVDQMGVVNLDNVDGAFVGVPVTIPLTCDNSVLTNPGGNTLPSGATLACTYSYTFPGAPPTVGPNQVLANRVTFTIGQGANASDVSYTEVFYFTNPTSVTNAEITVEDSFDGGAAVELGSVNALLDALPFTFDPYTQSFSCTEEGSTDYENTAEIVETGQTASAKVTVDCYVLDVEKDATTSFRWDWSIDKVEDDGTLSVSLNEGETATLNYTVTASATDVDHAVSGTITVTNNAPIDAVINGIADLVTPGNIPGDISCLVDDEEATFPYTLAAGEALECTYTADLPDREERTNTATATQQNYSYDAEGAATATGTTEYDDDADVVFGLGEDNCVEVWDDKTDPSNPVFLGHACAQDDASNPDGATLVDGDGNADFSYSLTVGRADGVDVYLECGETYLTNTAELRYLGEEEGFDQAEWTVWVDVYCAEPSDETAWAANGNVPLEIRYTPQGNWATYVEYAGVAKVTTMFAGRTTDVGTASFSAPSAEGEVTITIQLTGSWSFAAGSVVAVQDYDTAPSGNPAPGLFDHKVDASGQTVVITVPENNFYGVHAVVASP